MSKGKPAKPGIGSGLQEARSINTERTPKKNIGAGLPNTYYGNSKACNTESGKK